MATATSGKQTLPAINQQTWRQRISSYKRTPLSFLLFLLVSLSAMATVAVLVLLVGYILIKGIPNLNPSLFAWTYNSENVSMMPALINTILMGSLVAADCSACRYFLCHLSGGICQTGQ